MAKNKANYVSLVLPKLEAGESASKISKDIGCALITVYKVAERYGFKFDNRVIKQDKEQEIIDLIRAGEKRKDIAARFGVSYQTIRAIARKYKVLFAGDARSSTECRAKAKVETNNPGFEYVSGYKNYSSKIIIRCKTCKEERSVTYDSACRKKLICYKCGREHQCPICGNITTHPIYCSGKCLKAAEKRKEKEERQPLVEQRKAQRQAEREQKKLDEEHRKEEERKKREHPCLMCGKPTMNKKYCCPGCSRHGGNNRKSNARRAKVRGALVDNDITIEGVYQAGRGVCYLCGKPCDWEDKQERDGTIICGDKYPSIDHIVPLSRGGKHSWDNVALACRRCNYLKSDSVSYTPGSSF